MLPGASIARTYVDIAEVARNPYPFFSDHTISMSAYSLRWNLRSIGLSVTPSELRGDVPTVDSGNDLDTDSRVVGTPPA